MIKSIARRRSPHTSDSPAHPWLASHKCWQWMLWYRHHLRSRKLRRWHQLWKHIQLWKHRWLLQRLCRRFLQSRQSPLRQPLLQQRLQPESTLQPPHQQPTLEQSALQQSAHQQPALEQPENQQRQNQISAAKLILIILTILNPYTSKGGFAPFLLETLSRGSPPLSHRCIHL